MVAAGLAKTIRALTATKNEAAVAVLLDSLESPHTAIRNAALQALIDRRSAAGHRELLRRWHTLADAAKAAIAEKAPRMEGAVRDAILCMDPELHRNACDAVVRLRDYDLIPTLITAAEDKGNVHADWAARAVLQLCEALYDEMSAPRDYRNRRDPVLVRQYAYSALEAMVGRYDQHRRPELIEAFLLLARPDDSLLRQGLLDPHDKIYNVVVTLLTNSQRTSLQRILLRFLDDANAPPVIYSIVTRRKDAGFLKLLFQKLSAPLSQHQRNYLRRIESFAWLREDQQGLKDYTDEELRGLLQVVLASGMNRLRVFEVVKHILKSGGELSRRAACSALTEFKGNESNELVLAALEDQDPEVQANAVAQLRERGIPGIMVRLIEFVDSPHECVREAARQSLTEFNFQRYLGAFEMLEPDVRRNTGSLVKRVDPNALEQLQIELQSPARNRRLRGIEVAVAMGAVHDLEATIHQLAHDSDHFVRAEAARSLVLSDSRRTREILRELVMDRSVSVQEAAQQSLRRLESAGPLPPLPLGPGNLPNPTFSVEP